jgi:hypothetical protein
MKEFVEKRRVLALNTEPGFIEDMKNMVVST